MYHQATYLCSAHTLKQLPQDSGVEVAFAGRSNAGKSSAINALTSQKRLARTSKTPGRTQQIIFFTLSDTDKRLVDLPGYGFAKVPLQVKQHWEKLLDSYLRTRESLQGMVLMMDIRHPLTDFDQQMLSWCQQTNMPVHVLLTKADKLSYGKGKQVLQQVQQKLTTLSDNMTAQLFSATKQTGIAEAKTRLDGWLHIDENFSRI